MNIDMLVKTIKHYADDDIRNLCIRAHYVALSIDTSTEINDKVGTGILMDEYDNLINQIAIKLNWDSNTVVDIIDNWNYYN